MILPRLRVIQVLIALTVIAALALVRVRWPQFVD
jgi:hypothetical protein